MTPPSAKSSAWSVPNISAGDPDGSTEAPGAVVAVVEASGTTESRIRGGMDSLMKTVLVTSLRRTPGVTRLGMTTGATTLRRSNDAVSLVRFALVRLGCPRCLCHLEGGTRTGRTVGLGASRRSGRRMSASNRAFKKFAREVSTLR